MSEEQEKNRVAELSRKHNGDAKKIAEELANESNSSAPKAEPKIIYNDEPADNGYNPNFSGDTPKREETPVPKRDNVPTQRSSAPGSGASSKPSGGLDKKEQAPDLGKDYGEGKDNKRPEGQQFGPQDNHGTDIDNFPDRENPVDGSLPNQNPSDDVHHKDDLEKDEDGLDKKDKKDGEPPEGEPKDGKPVDGEPNNKNVDGKNPEAPDSSKKVDNAHKDNEATSDDPNSNGYGALKKKQKGNDTGNDSTDRARKNLEHNRRVQQGREQEGTSKKSAVDSSKKKDVVSANPFNNIGQKFQNGLRNMFGLGGGSSTTSKGIKPGQKVSGLFGKNFKNKLLLLIKTNPSLVVIIGVVIFLFLIILFFIADDAGKKKNTVHELEGIVSTGTVNLEGLQVELVNCHAKDSDYTVLENVDFDKYVLGVALAEIGPSSPDEAIKAQIIAARGFALMRNNGMCPSNPDDCFYGYNPSTKKIRMRACENDQVYWDYTKDIYRDGSGSVATYSPEATGGTLWKSALSAERQAEVEALAKEVEGKVLVDSDNKVISTNYVNTVSEQFISLANQGKNYSQILLEVYKDKGAAGFARGTKTAYAAIDYGDYVLSSDGHVILHERLDGFLEKNGTSLDEFNALIQSNVQSAGYGTRAGVVAAAVTLIAELGNNYGVKIPYYWSGGHFDGVVDGALGYWGGTHTGSVQCLQYANNQTYSYCGFDCSGFVPWAIKNGGFNISQMLAGDFYAMSGARKVTLSASSPVLQPGDLLESSGHIVLVVGIDEEAKQYICAEASGNSSGVLFTRRSYTGGSDYWGVDMENFYATRARS